MTEPLTGSPIQLQIAGKDDYDNEDSGAACKALVESLPEGKRAQLC